MRPESGRASRGVVSVRSGEESRAVELLDWLAGDGAGAAPRAAVVVAHPDDETIGAGSRLSRLGAALFVYTTDGAPRDAVDAAARGFHDWRGYAAARRRERDLALRSVGMASARVLELGCEDQGLSHELAWAARAVAAALAAYRPEVVLTHPYEGGHPDHDATAFAVHAACAMLREGGQAAPEVLEMAFYHLGAGGLTTGRFLEWSAAAGGERVVVATEAQACEKAAAVNCYATQRETLRWLAPEEERLRVAPEYDFTRPPHEGRLYYELHPWGITGERWAALAAAAMAELGLEGRL